MRDSNYRSISNNRAAVTITTSLYDRRALDVTSDKPLVNSLNHLTYLVSSSAKVRETLSNDGGIERLVEILLECHNPNYNSSSSMLSNEKKLLTAWKWTLAFQCLVLISTRGTEKIRKKVVRAGMLPVIATVLDNYMSLHETNSFCRSVCCTAGPPQPYSNPAVQHHTTQQVRQRHQVQENQFGEQPQARQDDPSGANVLQAQDHGQSVQPTNGIDNIEDDRQERFMDISFSAPNLQASQTEGFSEAFQSNARHENHNSLQNQGNDMMQRLQYLGSCDNSGLGCDEDTCDLMSLTDDIDNVWCEEIQSLTLDQLLNLVRGDAMSYSVDSSSTSTSGISDEIRRRLIIVIIIKKLREKKESEVIYNDGHSDFEYVMDNNLQFLNNLYLFDEASLSSFDALHSKITPRNFTNTGLIIPRDDDVVWCLQLLAYISKYPYLKDVLQNTHLVIDMSMRDREMRLAYKKQLRAKVRHQLSMNSTDPVVPKGKKYNPHSRLMSSVRDSDDYADFVNGFQGSSGDSPQLSELGIQNENFDLSADEFELCEKTSELRKSTQAQDFGDDLDEFEEVCEDRIKIKEAQDYLPPFEDDSIGLRRSNYLYYIRDLIRQAKLKENELDRDLTLYRIDERVHEFIQAECRDLCNTIIEKRQEEKVFLSKVWNYDTYQNFDIDTDDPQADDDSDDALKEYKKVNLFPMIEKFTFLAGTDMSYWSGVIMRNSCRRNDFKGGVRQCGNLECGRWEKFPREFSKCKRCKRTKYCSRECQMRAWHSHKNWCVPSNSSISTNSTQSGNFDNPQNRNGSSAPSDGEGAALNPEETAQNAHNHVTQPSEL